MPSEIECDVKTRLPEAPRCALLLVGPFLLGSRGLLSALANLGCDEQKKSQVMKAMRLTRNDHHRKLRAPIDDISDWLANAGVPDFCRPPAVSWRCTREDSSIFS